MKKDKHIVAKAALGTYIFVIGIGLVLNSWAKDARLHILDQMSKEHVQWMLSKVPRGRFLELNELTSMVCWLSSEENSFSTAAVFDISGGRSTY